MATTLDEAAIARDANRRIRRSGNIAGWAFAGPSVVIVLGLSFIPMIWAAYLSLTDSNLVSPGHFIGFANYAALAKDPLLRQAFTNTFLLAVMYLPIGLAAGLIVNYLAALQDIPQEVLEAASIDGAGRWAKFWHVTLPTVRPVTIFLLVWGLIDVFQFFDLVYTTTRGGPLNSTLTLVYYIWELAFNFFTAGYGAAVAYVLFFTSLIAIIAVLAYGRRRRITL